MMSVGRLVIKRRGREFESLSRDHWIILNSEIEPEKLHALGVIIFRWNLSENKLLEIFKQILNCSTGEAHILAYELGDIALMNRIKVLARTRIKDDPNLIATIQNILSVYEVCRLNRNQLSHLELRPPNQHGRKTHSRTRISSYKQSA